MKTTIIALFLLLCMQRTTVAQVDSLGRGMISGTSIHTVADATLYTDKIRAAVKDITPLTAGKMEITVGSAAIASQFSSTGGPCKSLVKGDMVLIIQMKGTHVGRHQNAFVTKIAGDVITVCTVSGVLVPFSTTGTANKVQIIKINEYENFTLTGGEVTCHPWDDAAGTGGVVCFLVRNKLTISGGVVNAMAKGLGPYGVTWAQGGVGAPAAGSWSAGGYPAPAEIYVGCDYRTIVPGMDGGAANNTAAAGVANIPFSPVNYYPGTPLAYTKAVMGQAGYYQQGYGSGAGAGGGGMGGDGANNCQGTGVIGEGNFGADGGKGGDAGKGASGGGIIIIKAKQLVASNPKPNVVYFDASGADGGYGEQGADGAQGGAGGTGAEGICEVCDPGGPGGTGETGAPGNGGDGGDGGGPGTIWIAAGSVTGMYAGNFRVDGGYGGYGGSGGYSWMVVDTAESPDPCTGPCPHEPCVNMTIVNICDKNRAFCQLALATTAANHIPGTHGISHSGYDYKDSSGNVFAIYDIVDNVLIGIDYDYPNCKEIHYIATLKGVTHCSLIFKMLAYAITHQKTFLGQEVDLSKTVQAGICSNPAVPPLITFKDKNGHKTFEYNGTYIESVPGFLRCNALSCRPAAPTIIPIGEGRGGRNGVSAEHGTKQIVTGEYIPDSAANVVVQSLGNALWKPGLNQEELNDASEGMSLYPQPAGREAILTLPVYYTGNIHLKIYDLNGKLIKDWTAALADDRHELAISLDAIARGVYILRVTDQEHQPASLKLVVW